MVRMGSSSWADPPSTIVYAGISNLTPEASGAHLAIVIRTPSDLVSFTECKLPRQSFQDASTAVPSLILLELSRYRELHNGKFAGVAVPAALAEQCPSLCLRLWKELDAVPVVIGRKGYARTQEDRGEMATFAGWELKQVDEQADSVVRKCLRLFGIGHVPLIHLDLHGRVEVDNDFRVRLVDALDYQRTVDDSTWSLARYFADDLRKRQVTVAFFTTTPHGRPDVHTRHALMRVARCLGVDFRWYVPRPRPQLLQIIRKMEDILQGVDKGDDRLTADEELRILEWVYTTAKRYWLSKGGPLAPAADGGADLVVIDDGILSPLALIAKQAAPNRPVVYENRLHVGDGAEDPASPQHQAWEFLRARMKNVDLVVSQEPREFSPRLKEEKFVRYISVAVDQLDGLNKHLHDWDVSFYGREFNSICRRAGTQIIDYPNEQYILHLSQLHPNEGTIPLLKAYKFFHTQCQSELPNTPIPKLVIAHYRSPHTPETAPIYTSILRHISESMPDLATQICIIQLQPPDQLWNVLLSRALVLVQLASYEGVPEILLAAVQRGTPVITDSRSGYLGFLRGRGDVLLVEDGEEIMARYLLGLAADAVRGRTVGGTVPVEVERGVRDRTTTVGNAVCWLFLASWLSRGVEGGVGVDGGDVYGLAEEAWSKRLL